MIRIHRHWLSFPGGSVVKNPPASAGDTGSIAGSARSPAGGHANPRQYACLENSMGRGTWWPGYSPFSVTKWWLTFCDPMECSMPGSSVHGISQARILEWVAISFPDQGSNSSLLHWQVDSLPLSHQGSPG